MKDMSDGTLLQATRSGSGNEAYAELYRRHYRAAMGAARRIAPALDHDEIVAESFTRILQAIRNGAGPNDLFRPYMYQVVRNTCFSEFSEESTAPMNLVDYEDVLDPNSLEDPAELLHIQSEVSAALDRLPQRWREVLWCTEVEGVPARELAEVLGTSVNNVSQLRRRAKKRLLAELGQFADVESGRQKHRLGALITLALLGGSAASLFPQHFATHAAAAAPSVDAPPSDFRASIVKVAASVVGVGVLSASAILLFSGSDAEVLETSHKDTAIEQRTSGAHSEEALSSDEGLGSDGEPREEDVAQSGSVTSDFGEAESALQDEKIADGELGGNLRGTLPIEAPVVRGPHRP